MIFLAVRRDTWQEKHESVTFVKSSRMLTELKCHPDFVWLKSVDSMALVSSTPSGKYFVSLCVEMDIELLLGRNNGQQIGIDVGITDLFLLWLSK